MLPVLQDHKGCQAHAARSEFLKLVEALSIIGLSERRRAQEGDGLPDMVYCVEKTARSVLFVWQAVAVELGIVMGLHSTNKVA